MNVRVLVAGCLLALASASGASAQGAPAADNSANNAPKRAGSAPTADQQSNAKSDVELTQRIRRSVMEDDSLSTYGKNVKIVSSGGKVTLNGVVKTADEKKQIGMKAASVAGADQVVNELKIAPAD